MAITSQQFKVDDVLESPTKLSLFFSKEPEPKA